MNLQLEGTDFLKCSVIDTGIGIPPELCKKLFRPYVRGHYISGINKTGAGFGLSISRRLCERLGGKIEVTSDVGKGSNFFFTLPLNSPAAPTELPKTPCLLPRTRIRVASGAEILAAPRVDNYSLQTNRRLLSFENTPGTEEERKLCTCPKVLCVDDLPTNIFVMREMLIKLGVKCDSVCLRV